MDPLTIIAAITAATKLVELGAKAIEERRRRGELTDEEERAWSEYLELRLRSPHWTPSGR